MLTHVDGFKLAGEKEFLEEVMKGIKTCMNVSKVEEDKFRFTGLDVERRTDGIVVSMNDYVDSLEEVKNIRKESGMTELTKLEMKQYRKYVGKLNWLAQSTRPDLGMAKRNAEATISHLKNIN